MISNSSPLIIFGKINQLELLKKVFKNIVISESVYKEVVEKGKEKNASESFLIDDYIKIGKFEVKRLSKKFKERTNALFKIYRSLDYGEAETIGLALQEKEKNVLIDEKIARDVAKLHGLFPLGTLGILLLAFKKKLIKEKEVEKLVNEILLTDFRISGNLIQEFWKLFGRIKKR